jgi:aldose sugar dehydrogenase
MRTSLRAVAVVGLCLVGACRPDQRGPAPHSPQPDAVDGDLAVDTIARGLAHPWSVALLPDGRFLVSERPGRLRIVSADGSLSKPLDGVPNVYAEGQGGLLDIALDPAFAANGVVYVSFSEPSPEGGTAGTAVLRARLGTAGLEDGTVIYRQEPKVQGGGHFGSRLAFAPDGNLFVTQGERFSYRERAQDLTVLLGKVVRIRPDGTIPDDNPFVGRDDARPEIWSYGHRNVQAEAIDPATGRLWTVEHGAMGGDELNHPEPGKNYGWPVITYGRDYSGMKIGEGTEKEGMEQPVYFWDPVIAPSGMAFYQGDAFPGWKGNILIGGLASMALVRLEMNNGAVVSETRYLHELGERIRDVQEGPDGFVYIVTDENEGKLLRVRPAGGS